MKVIATTCYMCDELASGDEHVPPKCIFPEHKDLPNGVDYRKQLFTVPSCDEHNSNKSKDDEYLFYVLTMNEQISSIGRSLYTSKTRRAKKRNPSLLKKFASTGQHVMVKSINGGQDEKFAYHLEEDRFNQIIDRLARAIYYVHYQMKWLISIKYQAEFLHSAIDLENADNPNALISKEADSVFSNADFFGDNPLVFKYQVVEDNNSRSMRLHFFEHCKLLLYFNYKPTEAVSGFN